MQDPSGMTLFYSKDDQTPVYKMLLGQTADQSLVVMPGIPGVQKEKNFGA